MCIKVDLEHADARRCIDFGCRIVSRENSDIEPVGGQTLQKWSTEVASLCNVKAKGEAEEI
jgi:hypothetical protein